MRVEVFIFNLKQDNSGLLFTTFLIRNYLTTHRDCCSVKPTDNQTKVLNDLHCLLLLVYTFGESLGAHFIESDHAV